MSSENPGSEPVSQSHSLPAHAASVYDGFVAPPREYGPLPFWFWNGLLREDEILRQLEIIRDAGCAGAIIYPRHGLRTPYLSPEWFGLVRAVLGARKDLRIWVADDENWPGGVGPDPGQAWYLKATRSLAASPGVLVVEAPGRIIGAGAIPSGEDESSISGSSILDLASYVRESTLSWSPPPGRVWDVCVFSAAAYPHRDMLAEGSGSRFLQSTHARYEDALGDLAASGITGFFSDELAPISVWNVPHTDAFPWTPDLEDEMARLGGGRLIDGLMPLAAGVDAGDRIRQAFWARVSERCAENFYGPVRRWLTKRGLQWAGHLSFEEPLLAQMMTQGDLPRMVRHFTMPVVDNLALRSPGLEVSHLASIARQMGSPAAVEAFGGSGWGLTLADRKRSLDAHVTRGIGRLIPHGVFYSSVGKRKLENPPGEFFREPFAAQYSGFASYARRLGWLMEQGRPMPRVALFYPLRSVWAAYRISDEVGLDRALDDDFNYVASLLEEIHYQYEIVDEESLAEATMVGDHIKIGDVTFPILVLPSCTCISRAAWQKILDCLDAGGQIVCLGMAPEGFEDGPSEALFEKIQELSAVDPEAVRSAYLLRARSPIAGQDVYTHTWKNAAGGRFSAFQAGISADGLFAKGEVRQILSSYAPSDFECSDHRVRYWRRSLGGLDIYWVFSQASERVDTHVTLRGHGTPESWDPLTGTRTPILQYTWVGSDQTVVTLRLEPGEGQLIALPAREGDHVDATNFVVESVRALGATGSEPPGLEVEGYDDPDGAIKAAAGLGGPPQAIWRQGLTPVRLVAPPMGLLPPIEIGENWHIDRLDPNVLVLPEWRFRRDERGGGRVMGWHRRLHLDWDSLPARQPLTWFPELEPLEIRPPGYAWFQTVFNIQEWEDGRPLRLALETIDAPFRCWVDGGELDLSHGQNAAPAAPRQPSLDDPGLMWADLTTAIATGHHSVTLLADYRGIIPERPTNRQRIPIDLAPGRARLVGSFAVMERSRGIAISSREPQTSAAQSWTEIGYPHYSGSFRYRRTLLIPAEYAGARLFLEIGNAGVVIAVSVDGRPVGERPWGPFRFELTEHLPVGRQVEIAVTVLNTSANAVLGRPDSAGLPGSVRVAAFRRVTLSSRSSA